MSSSGGRPDGVAPVKRRSFRRTLVYVLVAVSLLSVVLLGGLQYWQARQLITSTVEDILVDQQATRARAIRVGLERLRNQVSIAAGDASVSDAVIRFSAAFEELESTLGLLTPEQEAEVAARYADIAAAIEQAGLEVPDLLPESEAARYVQYHYLLQNPFPAEDRRNMARSETDDSSYGTVHAELHEDLVRFATSPAVGDVLLIDTEGRIVYSTDKRADFGTSIVTGPYRNTELANAVTVRLPTVPPGEAVYVDFERYLPAAGRPTLFATAAVRSQGATVGALVFNVRIEALNALTTSGGRFVEAGLGDSGEAYVVGSDGRMRSDSRLWIEDPAAYARRLDDIGADPELRRLIELFGSTVLIQPVQTEAVAAAFDGETFVGTDTNYLDVETLAVASPIGAEQLDWVLVTAVDVNEASAPLDSYTRRILVVASILVPLVALAAFALAARITQPVEPIVAAAADIAAGNLGRELPDLGRNEFGDLARRLNTLTRDLRDREQALAAEEEAITTLLLSALPPRVVQTMRSTDRDVGDLVDTATIIAISVEGLLDQTAIDQDRAVEFGVRLSRELEGIADGLGVERVRSSSAEHVFAAGLASPDPATSVAAEFAVAVANEIEFFGEREGLQLGYRMGMCSGHVVAAVLEADQLTYGVVGDAVRVALSLLSIAGAGQLLVCDLTAQSLQADWALTPAHGLLDLRGEPVAARILDASSRSASAASGVGTADE